MATVTIPDFLFSSFYYHQLEQALLAYIRVNAPELTSESDYESHIQLLRAFALVGHLNNTRVDVVANEQLLDSIQLRESLQRIYDLIGYKLKSATPAIAELVIRLSTVPTTDISEFIPIYSQWGTEQLDGEEIIYEATQPYSLNRADRLNHVFVKQERISGIEGTVETGFPTRFKNGDTEDPFLITDVDKDLTIFESANGNAGTYKIAAFIDSHTIEVTGASFVSEIDMSWGIFEYSVDHADAANDEVTTFPIWTDDTYSENAVYFSHLNVIPDQVDIIVGPGTPDTAGVLEYYDPDTSKATPNDVTDLGGKIKFKINSLLDPDGASLSRAGALVKVLYNPTGKSETAVSIFSASNNFITTVGLLGQTTVDTDARNYTLSVDWNPFPNLVDGTSDLANDGAFTFTLPMDTERRWTKATINSIEGYWFRYRAIPASASAYPILNNVKISEGNLFFPFMVTQGITIVEEIIGSSNGQANQEFTTLQGPVFDLSYATEVDETGGGSWIPWTEINDFLNSSSTDRHYKTKYDEEDRLKSKFGDNTNGRIPPLGTENIRQTYRIGGELDGNVGSNQITGNIDGISFVAAVGNPRPALGWTIKEGGDETDLERAKESGPASIRNQGKAVTPADIPYVAVNVYRTEEGAQIVERAFAEEELFGPKTIGLTVMGNGGEFLTSEQLADLELFYNGDRYSNPPVEGVLLLNSQLTAINYDPKPISCTYNVIGVGVTPEQIKNALTAYLQPDAKDENGNYIHDFGGEVATVKLDCAVDDVATGIKNLTRTLPTSDISLAPGQLPSPGEIIVTVQEP
jgi:hypothetical protein